MLISNRHRFVFVHVYKNAGTSITAALKPFALNRWQWGLHRVCSLARLPFPYPDPQPLPTHASAAEIASALGRETFNAYFRFAFVRNPWDWQVSLYEYMLRSRTHPQHHLIRGLGSFEAYIQWRCSHEVRCQKDFLYSRKGERLVDYVGRFESLDADFRAICARIGIRASLPRLNVSTSQHYRGYYTDDTIEQVRQAYQVDIDQFGYRFQTTEPMPVTGDLPQPGRMK